MSKVNSGVYGLFNLKNNKVYVGQTNRLQRRHYEHEHKLNKNEHPNDHLQNAWNKYGSDNFEFKILKRCPIDALDAWERWFISVYKSHNQKYGYNTEFGGNKNKIIVEETRKKMRENHADVRGENNPMYGVKRSKEVCDRISSTRIRTGVARGENNPFYGKTHSVETRKLISERNMGKSAWNKGKPYPQIRGTKNQNARYTLWDNHKVHYHKPRKRKFSRVEFDKCFLLKYNGKDVYIGTFIEFVSPTLIYNMIEEEL